MFRHPPLFGTAPKHPGDLDGDSDNRIVAWENKMKKSHKPALQALEVAAKRKHRHAYRAALMGGACWLLVPCITWLTNGLGFSHIDFSQIALYCAVGFLIAVCQYSIFKYIYRTKPNRDYRLLSLSAIGAHLLMVIPMISIDAFSMWTILLITAGLPLCYAFFGIHFGFAISCLLGWTLILIAEQIYHLIPHTEMTVDAATFELFFSTWLCMTVVGALVNGVHKKRKRLMVQWARAQQETTRILEVRNREFDLQTEALRRVNEQLHQKTMVDALTQLANRRRFDDYLQSEFSRIGLSGTDLERREETGGDLSVILIDVDFFKSYNDTYGHVQGDECLKQVANLIQSIPNRPADLIARYGGEEFVVVMPDTDIHGALKMAERIRDTVESARIPHRSSARASHITVSIGVAEMNYSGVRTVSALLAHADAALYQAKSRGRNQVVCDQPAGHPTQRQIPDKRSEFN